MRDYENYQQLIDKVAEIDHDAASYLLHVAPELARRGGQGINFIPGYYLTTVFTWCYTLQGHKYWRRLAFKLEEVEEE